MLKHFIAAVSALLGLGSLFLYIITRTPDCFPSCGGPQLHAQPNCAYVGQPCVQPRPLVAMTFLSLGILLIAVAIFVEFKKKAKK